MTIPEARNLYRQMVGDDSITDAQVDMEINEDRYGIDTETFAQIAQDLLPLTHRAKEGTTINQGYAHYCKGCSCMKWITKQPAKY